MTLNGVMPVTLRHFTEFGKHAIRHMTAHWTWYYSLVRVRMSS